MFFSRSLGDCTHLQHEETTKIVTDAALDMIHQLTTALPVDYSDTDTQS